MAFEAGLPFAVLRAYAGSDLPKVNPLIKTVTCPFTGEVLAAVPSVRPDITVIHAQKADRKGNVLLWGILGVQKEAALAAKRCIVTVEEIVDDLNAPMNSCVLPTWALTAVCHVPGGAHPSYAHGYNERDNRFYQAWDPIARDRGTFTAWIDEYIHGTADVPKAELRWGEWGRGADVKAQMGTPNGIVDGLISYDTMGAGQSWVRFRGLSETLLVASLVPVEEDVLRVRYGFMQPKSQANGPAAGLAKALIRDICKQLDQDKVIWDRMRFEPHPIICDGDGPIPQFRQWYSRYYATPAAQTG